MRTKKIVQTLLAFSSLLFLLPLRLQEEELAKAMAGLVVGGWFASAAIAKLADKIRDYLEGQYNYRKGVKDALKKLQQNLTKIQAVIHATEQQTQIQNPGLATWLRDLKDAAFDAEDLLDKFDYQLLKAKVEEQNQVRRNFASSSHNIVKHAKAFVKRLFFSDDDLNELREIVRSFDGIFAQTGDFLKLVEINESVNRRQETLEWRQTTSMPVEPAIVGRKLKIKNIVNSLVRRTDNSRSSNEIFSVLSIVGIGGVGKTTVAQHVFNNNEIKKHFDLKIWVCVSETFDVRRVTIEIILYCCQKEKEMIGPSYSDLTLNDLHLMNLETIQEILGEKLKGKRFLIVLDDMWNEMRTKWETLCKPFKFGKEGSRIIVTTRNHKVAATVETKETVNLEGLAEKDYWTFFKQCAFGDAILEHHPKLELIARKIAKKLEGLPLAAKTVGSILNSKLEEEHWRRVLESKLWEIEQPEDGIMPALKLSYEHLPAHLKQCFAYCSLFPKDYLYDKEKLVQLWMAQGFVPHHEERKKAEDIGVQYFDYLLQRCFFQKAEHFGVIDNYKIHDLLHDLAESISDHECCRTETDQPVQITKRARHLYIAVGHQVEICQNVCDIKKLRSLVVDDKFFDQRSPNSELIHLIQYILEESKQLRALVFSNIPSHLSLEAIGDLIHLRYMDISNYHMGILPKSCCKLYHLQVLHLRKHVIDGPNRFELSKDMNNLINLRHLNIEYPVDYLSVDGIGRLTCLQELRSYYVDNKYGCEVGQLRNMRQLRGDLKIYNLDYVKSRKDACEAMLHNKEHLKFLRLIWSSDLKDFEAKVHEEVIEGLRPHTNLKKLKIKRYRGLTSPSWLSKTWLSNLEYIKLEHCDAWEVLPPLGRLPFLKILHLKGMSSIKKIGIEFYGKDNDVTIFPSLEELLFEDMHGWKEWSGVEEGWRLFPRLRRLYIYGCKQLRGTIVLPTSTTRARLSWHDFRPVNRRRVRPVNCRRDYRTLLLPVLEIFIDNDSSQLIWSLPKELLTSIMDLKFIGHCFTSFTKEEEEWFQNLTFLKNLSFIRCYNLSSLPANMTSLSSLKRLQIRNCQNIKRLPEKGVPTSLEKLYIEACNKELRVRCRKSDGADWPKISHIPTITIEGKNNIRRLSTFLESPFW